MKTITIHYTTPYIGTIAKQGEHNQTELVFFLPNTFDGADFVNAEFVKRDGSTSVVDQLIPNNGTVSFPLTQDLTNVDGKMEIQLVAYKLDGTEITEIAKSGIFTCKIRKSLNVLYGEDQPGVIERILAFISYWAEKLPEMWAKKHWHENKALLDTITQEMLVSEQSDWNENDSTKKSFVKNRTHWSENEQVTTDYTVEWVGTTPTYQAQPWAADDLGITLNEGETYTLQVGGETTTDVCQKFTTTDQGLTQDYYYIGNLHIFDPSAEDNGFPMLLVMDKMWQNGEIIKTWNLVLTYDTLFGNDLSFIFGKTVAVYHPLSINYMPDGVIDGFSTAEAYPFTFLKHDGHTIPQHQISDAEPTTQSDDYTVPWLKPNVWHRFGSADAPVRSISILELEPVDNSVAEEYLIEFWTDDSTSSVWLPAVEWVDELTVEPNKHYQISIVNNVALWCATDMEEES